MSVVKSYYADGTYVTAKEARAEEEVGRGLAFDWAIYGRFMHFCDRESAAIKPPSVGTADRGRALFPRRRWDGPKGRGKRERERWLVGGRRC